VAVEPAPITTPDAIDRASSADPTIGGPPLFLPYTPPREVTEVADRRTRETRTLAYPDGTFSLEASSGPINYQDPSGAWQPIDLSLVADGEDGFKVAANTGTTRLGTRDGTLGSIELDRYRVSLRAPAYATGERGSDLDQNRVRFAAASRPDVWIRPVDIGLEFGATWPDAGAQPVVELILDPGELGPVLADDKRTIRFLDADGKFAGRIEAPILREGGEDGAPLFDPVSVSLSEVGDGTWTLRYALDPAWLGDEKRVFPVVLDPTWCIGQGAAGCDDNYTSSTYNYDTFVYDASPNSYEVGWTVLRTGYDVRSDDGGTYGAMRTLLHFKHVGLPDGAVLWDTDLRLRVCCNYGGAQGNTVYAYRITKDWPNPSSDPSTWNEMAAKYTTTAGVASTVPAPGDQHWDVDSIVGDWYTRTNQEQEDDFGFLLKMGVEDSGHGEVEYRRYNYGTAAYRPLLTLNFTLPKVGIDFDPRLGPAYAPSTMVTGITAKLPITVENKTGSAHTLDKCADGSDTDCWLVGFRWFDAKGNRVSLSGSPATTFDLPANVAVGGTSAVFPITITPPDTAGQYTLRLDLVHRYYGGYNWASDFAKPSLYYSRNKKLNTASSTRWTGTSAIERTEFAMNVTTGAGGGNLQAVDVASGGSVGIDLWSRNLAVSAGTGLGFADRQPLSLSYGYNEAVAELCSGYQGILAACGWWTNWDERITGGANQTGYDYVYQDASGRPYMMDTDASGQVVGGAPVLINRSRYTFIDENGGGDGPDGGTVPDVQAVLASGEPGLGSAFSGQYVGKAPSGTSTGLYSGDDVEINQFRQLRFAMRTSAAASSGLCFKVHNVSDPDNYPDRWFCYTTGTAWNTGFDEIDLGGTIAGAWAYYPRDLMADIDIYYPGNFGSIFDTLQVVDYQIQAKPGSTGSTYIDAFRLETGEQIVLDETNPSNWTSGQALTSPESTDVRVGATSIKATPASPPTTASPSCRESNGCWTSAWIKLWSYPFTHWYWRKAGGGAAAMVFYVRDERAGAPCETVDCAVFYYAGATPSLSLGVTAAGIRIGDRIPSTWTLVRRNLLEDARQALNLYDDDGTGAGDPLRLTGFAMLAIDGSHLLVDSLGYGSLADVASVDPTGPDAAGVLGQDEHPNTPGDTTFTYDFSADYPDGSRHYFNRDGLLTRIRDRDRQATTLDWTYDTNASGPSAYALTAIHAPGDTSSGGTSFDRQLTVSRGTDGSLTTITFDEDLGTASTDVSDRAVVFMTTATSGGDLVRVSPARTPKSGSVCGTTRPNGCVEYAYGASHRLQYLADPRWDGTSTGGAADWRLEIGRNGNDPVSILDRSHGSTPLLRVLTFSDTRDSTLRYTRPLWQDAAAGAANAAQAADLSPDGRELTGYTPRTCSGTCDPATQSTWPATGSQSNYKTFDAEFDGLSNRTSTKTYRCPVATDATGGCTAGQELVTLTRSEANAGAKIDNYADPLAAGRLLWQQDADQVFASLRDSGGANPDWYRTEYVYDGWGEVAETLQAHELRTSAYAATVKAGAPRAYYRLDETSGPTLTDSSGNGRNGSYPTAPTLGGAGVLPRDAGNKAPTFNGSTQYARATHAELGSPAAGSFSVEGWVYPTSDTTNQSWLASRNADFGFDAKVCTASCTGGKGFRFMVGNGTAWLFTATFGVDWRKNRWYYLAAAVDDAADRITVYLDGRLLATLSFPTAGTPILTNATHNLHIGQTGLSTGHDWFKGSIDEVGIYSSLLSASDVAAHYRAGRAIVIADATVRRDSVGRPIETATAFTVNGGFEAGTDGWALGSGAALATGGASGASSLALGSTATTQIDQLVPGQTFRYQFASKSSVGTTSVGTSLEYWKASTSAWTAISLGSSSFTNTGWASHAWDVSLPRDTDGRVRLSFSKSGAGTGWIDDVLVATAWGRVDYLTSPTDPLQLGLPTDRLALAVCAAGSPCASPTVTTHLDYVAATAGPDYHPAIFPTKVIANQIDGVQGPGAAEDATTTTAFDSWGRALVVTDPDGVDPETVYAANQTDVAATQDGLDATTTMAYDAIGNPTETTTPLGRVMAATFDSRGHRLTSTDPAGVVTRTDYDGYGRATATWANYVDGNPATGDGTDDLLSTTTYDAFGRVIRTDVECSTTACTGGLDARSTTTYDLLGNVVATTVYPGPIGTGAARTTASYFETYDTPATSEFGALKFSRTTASGTRLAVAPSGSPAPLCPGSASVRCNSVTSLDLEDRAAGVTDAYGIVTAALLDLGGRTVATIANYVDGTFSPGTPDEDVVSSIVYDIAGRPAERWDPLDRRDTLAYDALGRLLSTTHKDSAGATYLTEQIEYTPAGRVSRSNDGAAWTRTTYDGAGRAVGTIANDALAGSAGMLIDAFEAGTGAWSSGSSGFFTTAAATAMTTDVDVAGNAYHAVEPSSGRGRLHVTTPASPGGTGAWLSLAGPTYQATHVYKAAFDLRASAAGLSLTAFLGKDQSGGSYGQLGITTTTSWTPYVVSWTPASAITDARFAIGKASAGAAEIYLDNLVIWDTTAGWPDKGIVGSLSAYNADGEIISSVLPPGDPTTERPLVTTVGFDPAGRNVATTVNGASGTYAAVVLGTANLAAYVPLDERVGTTAADRKSGAPALNMTGAPRLGLAGGIDEARTAIQVGTGAYLARTSNATSATTSVSMEAWLRTDAANPASPVVVASNGTNTNGWGIGIDSSGNAAGLVIASSTLTTMGSGAKVNDGAWHHVVLTRDGTTWAMTLDGTPRTLASNTSSPGTPGAGFTIGALSDGSRAYTGEVDEVSVYTADITGSVAAHLAAGRRPGTDVVTALTSRTAFDRLGRATDTWGPDLVRTHAVYNRLGQQTETFLNYRDGTTSGSTADDDVRSTFAYDVLGELTGYCPAVQVKIGGCDPADANETQAWHYAFDDLGRQTKTIPPVNVTATAQVTQETVFQAGGRTDKTCAYPAGSSCGSVNSRHTDFTSYDDLGRVLTQQTWDRAGGSDSLKFTKTFTWKADGSPATVAEGLTTLTYEYDTAGRPSAFKNGSTTLTGWTYNAGTSTVATRTDGTLGATAFSYDWARRVTSIDPPDSYVAGVVNRTYRLDGLLATLAFPGAITETLAYDAVKRPVSIGLGGSNTLSQSFDRAGDVAAESRSLAGISGDAGANSQSFSYDGLHRLTGSSLSAASRSYTYDLDGNRLTRVEGGTTSTFTFDRADTAIDQTISGTVRQFTYDRYGNLTQAPNAASAYTTYAYDEANRLTTITPPGVDPAATFTMDPLDRHATRVVSGVTDTYGYVGPTETTFETGASGTRSLLDLDGSRLAVKNGSTVTWLVVDLHGSVAALCSTAGTLTDAYRYDAFGQTIANSGTSTNPWKYRGLLGIAPGSIVDPLYDMGARDYAPALGTFTQADSVQGGAANPLSMNRFLYALANPATLIDPDGHTSCEMDDCRSGYVAHGNGSSARIVDAKTGKPPKSNDDELACKECNESEGVPEFWTPDRLEDILGMQQLCVLTGWACDEVLRAQADLNAYANAYCAAFPAACEQAGYDAIMLVDLALSVAAALPTGGASLEDNVPQVERILTSAEREPGQWVRVIETMSVRAANFQTAATKLFGANQIVAIQKRGRAILSRGYLVNGTLFDAYDRIGSRLVDAKGPGYARLLQTRFGSFVANKLVEQAFRQVNAANGTPIVWRFAEEDAATFVQTLFKSARFQGRFDSILVEHWTP
jgi:RHS repeat-associated protein